MKNLQAISDCIEEIKNFAKANDDEISLFIVKDIIKNKKTGVDEDILNRALHQLQEQGVRILPLDMDEGYKADMDDHNSCLDIDGSMVHNVSYKIILGGIIACRKFIIF